jgi:hypothetical protein
MKPGSVRHVSNAASGRTVIHGDIDSWLADGVADADGYGNWDIDVKPDQKVNVRKDV